MKQLMTMGFSIVVLGSLAAPLFAASALEDPLWRKAIAVAGSASNWVPGLTITRTEILQKGKVATAHEVWQQSAAGPSGEVVKTTVKVLEDGKDVTARENKKSKKEADPKTPQVGGHPFDPTLQDRVSLRRVDHSKDILGRNCAGYEFDLRNTNGATVRGIAWLEQETGWPAEIENMTLHPPVDKRLKRLSITTRYESGVEGRWQMKQITTTSTVSVLFIKADVRSITTFSNYWQKVPPTDALKK